MALIDLNLSPGTGQLRQFGWIALVAFGILGVVIWWKEGLFGVDFGDSALSVSAVLWGLGLVSALFSAVVPAANRPLFVVLALIALPIGFVLSHLVLAILFFLILTPVGLLFRIMGRDALERPWEPQRSSYWVDLPAGGSKSDYFRQF